MTDLDSVNDGILKPFIFMQMSQTPVKRKQRSLFKPDEDKKLKELVKGYTSKPNWKEISANFPNKSARQCRERYRLYLSPEIKHLEWTKEDDILLLELVIKYGKHWATIKKYFPGRSDNMIKNRFNFHIMPIRKTKNVKHLSEEFLPFQMFLEEEDSETETKEEVPIKTDERTMIFNIENENLEFGEKFSM